MTSEVNPAEGKANIVLDASKIDMFETCPARYNFRYNHNKSLPMINKAPALDMGTLVHAGMEAYYNALAAGTNFKERLEEAQFAIRSLASDPDQSNSEPEQINTVLDAVESSVSHWRPDDENCLTIKAVEAPFAYPLYEDEYVRIILTGKIDLLVDYRGIGGNASYENLVIDHKSFSRNGPVYRKTNQFINYANAAGTNYLLVNRVGFPKSLSVEEKFKRLPLSYDPTYIQSWKNNITKMILNEYLGCVAEGYWPEKPTSCNKFNRLCEYYDICDSSGDDVKVFKLENNYIDAPIWDVTSSLEK